MATLSPQSALEMVNEVAQNVGVRAVESVTANDMSKLLLNMLNRAMQHAVMAYDWPQLTVSQSVSVNLDDTEYIPLPTDFLKIISRYIFVSDGKSSGNAYRKFTHCSPEESLNATYLTAKRTYNRFYVRRQSIFLIPANVPSAETEGTLKFNYYYKSCLAAINGDDIERDTKKSLEIDTDQTLLEPELLIIGAIMFYKKFSGQPYDMAMQSYNERLKSLIDGATLGNYNPDVVNEGHISESTLSA
ncbi:MAG: hypothetical protein LBS38_00265 [Endomicrobium sp.]|jgi:hypothetical protein|nr:hypothetical protein [Endomicrobium sp.]